MTRPWRAGYWRLSLADVERLHRQATAAGTWHVQHGRPRLVVTGSDTFELATTSIRAQTGAPIVEIRHHGLLTAGPHRSGHAHAHLSHARTGPWYGYVSTATRHDHTFELAPQKAMFGLRQTLLPDDGWPVLYRRLGPLVHHRERAGDNTAHCTLTDARAGASCPRSAPTAKVSHAEARCG